jgi:hypothetical protein
MRAILVGMMLVVGCGGGGGEPIEGTVTIDWGDDHVVPTVGAAIEDTETADAENMLVYIGTTDIDCGTTFESRINPGTYVAFSVDRTAPGEHTPPITIIRVEGGSGHFNSASGMVTIDMIGDRVTGDFMVETTDDEAGALVAGGTFDVIRCF